MLKNLQIGVGSIIADDTRLGKTLQVIALLHKMHDDGIFVQKKALIVVPTSLLPNWEAEFAKFAPELRFFVHYGPQRNSENLRSESIVLTSYGVLRSDIDKLKKLKWAITIIDEAQNIKNPIAQLTVSTGENWIGKMNDRELAEVFELSDS